MTGELPPLVADLVGSYLAAVDEAAPGFATGAYVVGSTALGAFVPGRSDVDLFVLVDHDPTDAGLAGLRSVHRRLYRTALAKAVRRGRYPLVVNASVLRWTDLGRPPAEVEPVASHVAGRFHTGAAFDVNPVGYRVLATRGIALRGPSVDQLDVHEDPNELRRWNLGNLDTYWAPWGDRIRRPSPARLQALAFRQGGVPWGALGPPRLLHTIETGEVISKEAAGELVLDRFDARFHPVVTEALAYWRGQASPFGWTSPRRLDACADLVDEVVDRAHRLA